MIWTVEFWSMGKRDVTVISRTQYPGRAVAARAIPNTRDIWRDQTRRRYVVPVYERATM